MILDIAFGVTAVLAMGTAIGLVGYSSLGARATALAALTACSLCVVLARLDPRAALAMAAGALALCAPLRAEHVRLRGTATVLGLGVAIWSSPPIGLAALAALPWSLPDRRAGWAAWLAACSAVAFLPRADGFPALGGRIVLVALAVGAALAGRRAIGSARAGPSTVRVAVAVAVALPSVALFALALAYGRRVTLASDAFWPAIGMGIAAIAAGLVLGLALIGLVIVASTTNDLKRPLGGWVVGALIALPIVGIGAASLLVLVGAIGLPIGSLSLWKLAPERKLLRLRRRHPVADPRALPDQK